MVAGATGIHVPVYGAFPVVMFAPSKLKQVEMKLFPFGSPASGTRVTQGEPPGAQTTIEMS